jgi:RecJ-like exonuclease
MKSKLLIAAFIAILICSAFTVALTMALCPRCNGTGKIECPYCDGTGEITVEEGEPCGHCEGTGTVEPNLILIGKSHGLSDGKISVRATCRNDEDVNVYGRVTLEVEVQDHTYTVTSSNTTFPPHEETEVTLDIDGISSADYDYLQNLVQTSGFASRITFEVDDVVCPYCDGTGLVSSTLECPQCGGTGFVDCPVCGGLGVATGEHSGEIMGNGDESFAVITFDVVVETSSFVIEICSNSSVSGFVFDPSLKRLRFDVAGDLGTSGLCDIAFPLELMSGDFSIYIDDITLVKNVDYTETSNGTHYLFSISYEHSTHTIDVISTEAIPEFPSWVILPMTLAITLIAMKYRKKLRYGNPIYYSRNQ